MVSILFYFILGIIIYNCIRPILQQLVGLICQSLEFLKSKIILAQSKVQQEIDKLESKEPIEDVISNKLTSIGFAIENAEEEDNEEDEDDD